LAISVSTDLSFFSGATGGTSDCDSTTDWAGATLTLVTDFFVQGTGCIGVKATATPVTVLFTILNTVDLTGKAAIIWAADLEIKKLDTIANGGFRIILEDSSARQRVWYVAGKDTWHGGWKPFIVHADKTPEPGLGSSTTGFDVTAIKKVGIYVVHTAAAKLSPNFHWDAVRYGTGLSVKGETSVGGGTTYRARSSNVATITTASAHGRSVGDIVRIRGLGGTGYNGVWTIASVPTTTTFTYSNTGANESQTADTNGIVATPASLQSFLDAEVAQGAAGPNYGVISKDRGVIFCQGRLTIGSTVNASGEETYFLDRDQILVFPSLPVLQDFFSITFRGNPNSASPTDIYFGDPTTDVGGLVIKAEDWRQPFKIAASDIFITKFGFYSCIFLNARAIVGQAYNADKEFIKCNFVRCSRMEPGTGIVDGCNFVNAADYEPIWGAIALDAPSAYTRERTEANNDTINDMTLLPTTPAVDDAYYFGSFQRFPRLKLKIDTPGVGTWTITWEYWNGTTWSALSGVSDGTDGFRPTSAGTYTVSYTFPSDWTMTTVNGINAYWIRGRVSTYTSVTTAPKGSRGWTWNRSVLIDSTSHNTKRSNFINCGTAVHISATGTYVFDAMMFSGAADAFDIENSTSGAVYIDRTNGSNPSSGKLYNSGGGSTTINPLSVNLRITVKDTANNPIEYAQCAIYKTSDDSELMNEDSLLVGGEAYAEQPFQYLADTDVYWRVRKSSVGATKYVPVGGVGKVVSSGFSITVTLYQEALA